jgi:hypothetical protein
MELRQGIKKMALREMTLHPDEALVQPDLTVALCIKISKPRRFWSLCPLGG